jgi:hypothetical protein
MTRATCLCGSVRYEFAAPLTTMAHCHCSMCRKHHGSAFATFVGGPLEGFAWLAGEAQLATYRSSEQGARSFCRTCGAVGPTLLPEMGVALAPAGNLESDPGIRPQCHMFATSKAAWFEITDLLPQHAGYPPEFGGGMGVQRPAVPVASGGIAGSCLCGAVGYELDATLRMLHCHCSRCRQGRSAAHATNVVAALDALRWTRGMEFVAEYKVPSARFFGVAFCTICGGAAPRLSRERGWAVVPAGTLDTDPILRPQAHIFVGSKAPWFEITDALPQFAEMPA